MRLVAAAGRMVLRQKIYKQPKQRLLLRPPPKTIRTLSIGRETGEEEEEELLLYLRLERGNEQASQLHSLVSATAPFVIALASCCCKNSKLLSVCSAHPTGPPVSAMRVGNYDILLESH
jgi:hypothetical protein